MPSIAGSFMGKITKQSGLTLADQSSHEVGLAEVSGTHQSCRVGRARSAATSTTSTAIRVAIMGRLREGIVAGDKINF